MKRIKHLRVQSFSSRFDLTFCLVLLVATAIAAPRASATAIANSSLQLESLTITPASGSIVFSPTAQSFAQAQNSLGELVSNFDMGTSANSNATVTWADASGLANSIAQTASASANVHIPGAIVGAASSVGRGTLFDQSFSITGTTGSVPVQFSLVLPYMQSLMTDANGVQATSEVILDLSIDGNTVLFFDSPASIGANSSFAASGSPTISNSMTLTAGQRYDLHIEVDAESSGINTPEPATLSLLLGGALFSMVSRKFQS